MRGAVNVGKDTGAADRGPPGPGLRNFLRVRASEEQSCSAKVRARIHAAVTGAHRAFADGSPIWVDPSYSRHGLKSIHLETSASPAKKLLAQHCLIAEHMCSGAFQRNGPAICKQTELQ